LRQPYLKNGSSQFEKSRHNDQHFSPLDGRNEEDIQRFFDVIFATSLRP
jgi:hypothetical protein